MDFPAGGTAAVISGVAAAYQNKIANAAGKIWIPNQ